MVTQLQLESEDQLLEIINDLYTKDLAYCSLYSFVDFSNFSTAKMKEFVQKLSKKTSREKPGYLFLKDFVKKLILIVTIVIRRGTNQMTLKIFRVRKFSKKFNIKIKISMESSTFSETMETSKMK